MIGKEEDGRGGGEVKREGVTITGGARRKRGLRKRGSEIVT